MDPWDLEPSQLVIDKVLTYSPVMPKMDQAAVLKGNLVFLTRNHRGDALCFNAPIHFGGEPIGGAQPRFVLTRIWNEVWKLNPSFSHDLLHCYITIVGVPEGTWPL